MSDLDTIKRVNERLDGLREKCVKLALELDCILAMFFKALEREQLLTYDEYADLREALSELKHVIEELRYV